MIIISAGLSTAADADLNQKQQHNIKPMQEHQIKHMDRELTKHQAIKKIFITKKEFLHKENRRINKHFSSKQAGYDRRYVYDNKRYKEVYHPIKQHGYKQSKRGWTLAYIYDRASFYDKEGFYYGYFNRHGYYFENLFYRYDRYYTYNDRIKGRGLFDHRYYMPANSRYYGFYK